MDKPYTQLPWDTNFFGIKTAIINLDESCNIDEVNQTIHLLKENKFRLAYWKTNPNNADIQDIAIRNNGVLVDQKVTYGMCIKNDTKIDEHILSYKGKVTDTVYTIALQTGEYSRFKKDKNIGAEHFTSLYKTWIENSVARINASEVFVYQTKNKIAGLITLATIQNDGSIGLIGVNQQHRQRGIGQKLIDSAHAYFYSQNIKYLTVVTQKENVPACMFYKKCGFSIIKIENVYHFWL
jgi:dTDP-4-amino-4,6-dideoxy-D-galactose acyltransferase